MEAESTRLRDWESLEFTRIRHLEHGFWVGVPPVLPLGCCKDPVRGSVKECLRLLITGSNIRKEVGRQGWINGSKRSPMTACLFTAVAEDFVATSLNIIRVDSLAPVGRLVVGDSLLP